LTGYDEQLKKDVGTRYLDVKRAEEPGIKKAEFYSDMSELIKDNEITFNLKFNS
jgi:hypothetical protein